MYVLIGRKIGSLGLEFVDPDAALDTLTVSSPTQDVSENAFMHSCLAKRHRRGLTNRHRRKVQDELHSVPKDCFLCSQGGDDGDGHVAIIDFGRMYPPGLSSPLNCDGHPICVQAALTLPKSYEPRLD